MSIDRSKYLAVVTAEHSIADQRSKRDRNDSFMFDCQIGNALPSV